MYKEALDEYAKLIAEAKADTYLKSRINEIYTNKALAEINLAQYEAAINDANEVIRNNSAASNDYNIRGYAHYLSGNYAKAIADYDKAAENKRYRPLFEYKIEASSALKTNKATPIVNIQWLNSMTDTHKIINDTLKLDNTFYLSVNYRVSSTVPLNKENIKVCVDGKEIEEVNSIFTKSKTITQAVKQANGNTLYIYDVLKTIQLFDKNSEVKAIYGNYSSPKLYVLLNNTSHIE
jgi:tetratricopeptide (TPR) repeat protein